jgi:glycosyltransferase involved in cell wall biosynthesis
MTRQRNTTSRPAFAAANVAEATPAAIQNDVTGCDIPRLRSECEDPYHSAMPCKETEERATTKTPVRRVLLLAESPYMGGITSHLLAIMSTTDACPRYAFSVATLPGRNGRESTLIDAMRKHGHEIHEFQMSNAADLRILTAIRAYVKENNIDLVHSHNYRATILAALSRSGVPLVVSNHGVIVNATLRMKTLLVVERVVMSQLPVVIACSNFVKSDLAVLGLDPNRIETVYNGFKPRADAEDGISRENLGIGPDRIVFLYAGRLVEGKGLDDLLDAARQIPSCTLIIAGEGPLSDELKATCASYEIDAHFVGRVDPPDPYYRICDVVILPSEMEAMPMTLIEAAAFGKPVIATRVGGIPEIVLEGETGLLVPPRDPNALAQAMQELSAPGMAGKMGEQALKEWSRSFTPEHMVEKLCEVYDRALEAHSGKQCQ